MKKSLTYLFLLVCIKIFSLPNGNPSSSIAYSDGTYSTFRGGFYGDYVFNRKLKVHGSNQAIIDSTSLNTNAAFLVFNFSDIDVYTTIGATNLKLSTPGVSFYDGVTYNDIVNIVTETDASFSLGLRETLWTLNQFSLGLNSISFLAPLKLKYAYSTYNSKNVDYLNNWVFYSEYQINLGASYFIPLSIGQSLTPYASLSWGYVIFNTNNTPLHLLGTSVTAQFYNLTNARRFGYALGLTLFENSKLSLTAEARFISENALFINAQYLF